MFFVKTSPGYAIRVDRKLPGGHMEGILIYDRSQKYSQVALTVAEKGQFYTTPNHGELIMELVNGHNYIEPLAKNQQEAINKQNRFFYRTTFEKQKLMIPLKSLQFQQKLNQDYTNEPKAKTYSGLQEMIQAIQTTQKVEKEASQALLSEQDPSPKDAETALKLDTLQPMVDAFFSFRSRAMAHKLDPTERTIVHQALYELQKKIDQLQHQQ